MKFSKLILKNILRNKRRTLLTISSLVVSLFLIITLATILTEFLLRQFCRRCKQNAGYFDGAKDV